MLNLAKKMATDFIRGVTKEYLIELQLIKEEEAAPIDKASDTIKHVMSVAKNFMNKYR